jgi:oxygen-independent coproporphyrinogen-3 oxidase
MSEPFANKDNEFIAWYPLGLKAEDAKSMWAPRPAAYYIHIPFCTAICDYCGFAVEKKRGANISRYLSALRQEIESYARAGLLSNHRFDCGHFGGGTPSAIEASELLAIKALIDSSFNVASNPEVTVEVNPISFTLEKAQAYHDAGVNRISFGLQSFNERLLKIIGRPHRKRDVEETLDVIRSVGWSNYSLDLIYGVPSQTIAELREDLQRTVDAGPSHVSCFRLEIIPFTALKLREGTGLLPKRLSIALLNEMDDLVTSVLTANGYREYGAFNFARPGYESVHNRIAFMAPQGEYIGFGNGSYSYINNHIYCNYASLEDYEAAVFDGCRPIALGKQVDALESMSRFFVLGLKFFRVSRADFLSQFGLTPESVFEHTLARLISTNLLRLENDEYVLTRTGRHYVNNVAKEFFVASSRGQRQHAQFVPNLTPEKINYYSDLLRGTQAAVENPVPG